MVYLFTCCLFDAPLVTFVSLIMVSCKPVWAGLIICACNNQKTPETINQSINQSILFSKGQNSLFMKNKKLKLLVNSS